MACTIDLSYLTEAEQNIILDVLKRDDIIRQVDEQRISTLRAESIRYSQQRKQSMRVFTGEWFKDAGRQMVSETGTNIVRQSMRRSKSKSKRVGLAKTTISEGTKTQATMTGNNERYSDNTQNESITYTDHDKLKDKIHGKDKLPLVDEESEKAGTEKSHNERQGNASVDKKSSYTNTKSNEESGKIIASTTSDTKEEMKYVSKKNGTYIKKFSADTENAMVTERSEAGNKTISPVNETKSTEKQSKNAQAEITKYSEGIVKTTSPPKGSETTQGQCITPNSEKELSSTAARGENSTEDPDNSQALKSVPPNKPKSETNYDSADDQYYDNTNTTYSKVAATTIESSNNASALTNDVTLLSQEGSKTPSHEKDPIPKQTSQEIAQRYQESNAKDHTLSTDQDTTTEAIDSGFSKQNNQTASIKNLTESGYEDISEEISSTAEKDTNIYSSLSTSDYVVESGDDKTTSMSSAADALSKIQITAIKENKQNKIIDTSDENAERGYIIDEGDEEDLTLPSKQLSFGVIDTNLEIEHSISSSNESNVTNSTTERQKSRSKRVGLKKDSADKALAVLNKDFQGGSSAVGSDRKSYAPKYSPKKDTGDTKVDTQSTDEDHAGYGTADDSSKLTKDNTADEVKKEIVLHDGKRKYNTPVNFEQETGSSSLTITQKNNDIAYSTDNLGQISSADATNVQSADESSQKNNQSAVATKGNTDYGTDTTTIAHSIDHEVKTVSTTASYLPTTSSQSSIETTEISKENLDSFVTIHNEYKEHLSASDENMLPYSGSSGYIQVQEMSITHSDIHESALVDNIGASEEPDYTQHSVGEENNSKGMKEWHGRGFEKDAWRRRSVKKSRRKNESRQVVEKTVIPSQSIEMFSASLSDVASKDAVETFPMNTYDQMDEGKPERPNSAVDKVIDYITHDFDADFNTEMTLKEGDMSFSDFKLAEVELLGSRGSLHETDPSNLQEQVEIMDCSSHINGKIKPAIDNANFADKFPTITVTENKDEIYPDQDTNPNPLSFMEFLHSVSFIDPDSPMDVFDVKKVAEYHEDQIVINQDDGLTHLPEKSGFEHKFQSVFHVIEDEMALSTVLHDTLNAVEESLGVLEEINARTSPIEKGKQGSNQWSKNIVGNEDAVSDLCIEVPVDSDASSETSEDISDLEEFDSEVAGSYVSYSVDEDLADTSSSTVVKSVMIERTKDEELKEEQSTTFTEKNTVDVDVKFASGNFSTLIKSINQEYDKLAVTKNSKLIKEGSNEDKSSPHESDENIEILKDQSTDASSPLGTQISSPQSKASAFVTDSDDGDPTCKRSSSKSVNVIADTPTAAVQAQSLKQETGGQKKELSTTVEQEISNDDNVSVNDSRATDVSGSAVICDSPEANLGGSDLVMPNESHSIPNILQQEISHKAAQNIPAIEEKVSNIIHYENLDITEDMVDQYDKVDNKENDSGKAECVYTHQIGQLSFLEQGDIELTDLQSIDQSVNDTQQMDVTQHGELSVISAIPRESDTITESIDEEKGSPKPKLAAGGKDLDAQQTEEIQESQFTDNKGSNKIKVVKNIRKLPKDDSNSNDDKDTGSFKRKSIRRKVIKKKHGTENKESASLYALDENKPVESFTDTSVTNDCLSIVTTDIIGKPSNISDISSSGAEKPKQTEELKTRHESNVTGEVMAIEGNKDTSTDTKILQKDNFSTDFNKTQGKEYMALANEAMIASDFVLEEGMIAENKLDETRRDDGEDFILDTSSQLPGTDSQGTYAFRKEEYADLVDSSDKVKDILKEVTDIDTSLGIITGGGQTDKMLVPTTEQNETSNSAAKDITEDNLILESRTGTEDGKPEMNSELMTINDDAISHQDFQHEKFTDLAGKTDDSLNDVALSFVSEPLQTDERELSQNKQQALEDDRDQGNPVEILTAVESETSHHTGILAELMEAGESEKNISTETDAVLMVEKEPDASEVNALSITNVSSELAADESEISPISPEHLDIYLGESKDTDNINLEVKTSAQTEESPKSQESLNMNKEHDTDAMSSSHKTDIEEEELKNSNANIEKNDPNTDFPSKIDDTISRENKDKPKSVKVIKKVKKTMNMSDISSTDKPAPLKRKKTVKRKVIKKKEDDTEDISKHSDTVSGKYIDDESISPSKGIEVVIEEEHQLDNIGMRNPENPTLITESSTNIEGTFPLSVDNIDHGVSAYSLSENENKTHSSDDAISATVDAENLLQSETLPLLFKVTSDSNDATESISQEEVKSIPTSAEEICVASSCVEVTSVFEVTTDVIQGDVLEEHAELETSTSAEGLKVSDEIVQDIISSKMDVDHRNSAMDSPENDDQDSIPSIDESSLSKQGVSSAADNVINVKEDIGADRIEEIVSGSLKTDESELNIKSEPLPIFEEHSDIIQKSADEIQTDFPELLAVESENSLCEEAVSAGSVVAGQSELYILTGKQQAQTIEDKEEGKQEKINENQIKDSALTEDTQDTSLLVSKDVKNFSMQEDIDMMMVSTEMDKPVVSEVLLTQDGDVISPLHKEDPNLYANIDTGDQSSEFLSKNDDITVPGQEGKRKAVKIVKKKTKNDSDISLVDQTSLLKRKKTVKRKVIKKKQEDNKVFNKDSDITSANDSHDEVVGTSTGTEDIIEDKCNVDNVSDDRTSTEPEQLDLVTELVIDTNEASTLSGKSELCPLETDTNAHALDDSVSVTSDAGGSYNEISDSIVIPEQSVVAPERISLEEFNALPTNEGSDALGFVKDGSLPEKSTTEVMQVGNLSEENSKDTMEVHSFISAKERLDSPDDDAISHQDFQHGKFTDLAGKTDDSLNDVALSFVSEPLQTDERELSQNKQAQEDDRDQENPVEILTAVESETSHHTGILAELMEAGESEKNISTETDAVLMVEKEPDASEVNTLPITNISSELAADEPEISPISPEHLDTYLGESKDTDNFNLEVKTSTQTEESPKSQEYLNMNKEHDTDAMSSSHKTDIEDEELKNSNANIEKNDPNTDFPSKIDDTISRENKDKPKSVKVIKKVKKTMNMSDISSTDKPSLLKRKKTVKRKVIKKKEDDTEDISKHSDTAAGKYIDDESMSPSKGIEVVIEEEHQLDNIGMRNPEYPTLITESSTNIEGTFPLSVDNIDHGVSAYSLSENENTTHSSDDAISATLDAENLLQSETLPLLYKVTSDSNDATESISQEEVKSIPTSAEEICVASRCVEVTSVFEVTTDVIQGALHEEHAELETSTSAEGLKVSDEIVQDIISSKMDVVHRNSAMDFPENDDQDSIPSIDESSHSKQGVSSAADNVINVKEDIGADRIEEIVSGSLKTDESELNIKSEPLRIFEEHSDIIQKSADEIQTDFPELLAVESENSLCEEAVSAGSVVAGQSELYILTGKQQAQTIEDKEEGKQEKIIENQISDSALTEDTQDTSFLVSKDVKNFSMQEDIDMMMVSAEMDKPVVSEVLLTQDGDVISSLHEEDPNSYANIDTGDQSSEFLSKINDITVPGQEGKRKAVKIVKKKTKNDSDSSLGDQTSLLKRKKTVKRKVIKKKQEDTKSFNKDSDITSANDSHDEVVGTSTGTEDIIEDKCNVDNVSDDRTSTEPEQLDLVTELIIDTNEASTLSGKSELCSLETDTNAHALDDSVSVTSDAGGSYNEISDSIVIPEQSVVAPERISLEEFNALSTNEGSDALGSVEDGSLPKESTTEVMQVGNLSEENSKDTMVVHSSISAEERLDSPDVQDISLKNTEVSCSIDIGENTDIDCSTSTVTPITPKRKVSSRHKLLKKDITKQAIDHEIQEETVTSEIKQDIVTENIEDSLRPEEVSEEQNQILSESHEEHESTSSPRKSSRKRVIKKKKKKSSSDGISAIAEHEMFDEKDNLSLEINDNKALTGDSSTQARGFVVPDVEVKSPEIESTAEDPESKPKTGEGDLQISVGITEKTEDCLLGVKSPSLATEITDREKEHEETNEETKVDEINNPAEEKGLLKIVRKKTIKTKRQNVEEDSLGDPIPILTDASPKASPRQKKKIIKRKNVKK